MFAVSMLGVVLFAMIFMTVNAVYAILDEWNYCTLRNWGIIIFTSLFTIIIIFTSLFTIILWVLFLV